MTTPSNPLSVFFNNNGQATIYNATASTSTNTGALTVYGGLGVGTNLYTNLATVTNASSATSTSTGALTVAGGVGIGGNVYVSGSTPGDGGTFNGTGSLVYIKQNTTWTGQQPWALYVSGYSYFNGFRINGFDGQRSLFAANSQIGFATGDTSSPITFTTQNSLERVRIDTTGTVYIGTTTQYNNSLLNVLGGVYVGGTATSVSTSTGALTVVGGVGVGGDVNASNLSVGSGYYLFLGGNSSSTRIRRDGGLNGMDLQTNSTSRIFISDNGYINFTTTTATNISSLLQSTSTTTGALIVAGGIGVNGQIYAGSSATISVNASAVNNYGSHITLANPTGSQTLIGWTFGGTPKASIRVDNSGNVVINASSNNIYFNNDLGTSASPLQFLFSNNLYQQVLGTTSTFLGNLIANSGTNATSTNTGALQVRGGLGVGGSIYAGGGITSVSTTTFVSPNSSATIVARMLNSDVLTFSGARGQLFSISDSFTGTIFGVYDISGVPAIEAYDTGNVILGETFGNVGVGVVTTAATAKLTIGGGVNISGITTVTNTTQATSTQSGALQVTGGVGIGGNLYVGGTLNAASVVGNISTATNANNINITNDTASVGLQYLTFVAASSGYNSLKTAATSGLSYYPNSGNLGIGGNPSYRLTVYTTATNTDGLYLASSVGGGNVFLRPNNSQSANNSITQAGDAGIIYSSSAGVNTGGFVIAPWYNGTSGMRFDSSGTVTIPLAQDATTTATGGLRVTGGVGIGGTLYANNAVVSNQTSSTSSTTGALIVSGGAGIRKDLWVGGGVFASTLTVGQTYTQGTGIAQINGAMTVNGTAINKVLNLQGGNNLLVWSTDLTNGNWNKAASSLTNTGIVAPDGISTSALLTATNAFAFVGQAVTISAGQPYTFSAFVKYRDQQYFTIALSSLSQATGFVNYDILNGSVSSTGQGIFNATITSVTNGWYRVSASYLSSATISINYNLWVGAYTGINYSPTGVYLWKPQVEVGLSASTPTDTSGSVVTASNNLYLPSGIITANSLEGTPIGQTTSSSASFTTATVRSTSQNLIAYSTPTTGFWNTYTAGGTGSATIVYNTATDPNYAGSAAQVSISSVNLSQVAGVFVQINNGAALPAATTYTGSVYMRGQNGGEIVWLMLEDNNTIIATTATLTTSWARYSITGYRTALAATFLGIGGWGLNGYTLANSSTFYVWGGQVVQGDRTGPYTPTNGNIVFNAATLSFNGAATVSLTNNAVLSVSTGVSIASVTSATSTTTGALTVVGGVGIGGDLYLNGNEYIQKTNITASADSIAALTYTTAYASTISNTDIFFKSDGTKMFGVSSSGVYQWSLGTAWSITGTITSGTVFSLASIETAASGLTFSPDGTKMVVIGNTAVANATFGIAAGDDRAYYFTLSTPWDSSSATLAGTIRFATGQQGYSGTSETSPSACAFDSTGSYFYMIGTNVRRVFQYTLSSPYTVTTATSTYTGGIVLTEDTLPQGLSFNYAGTRMYVSGQTLDFIYEYRLSTPWDVTTAVFYDKYLVGFQNGSMTGLYINDTATNNIFLTGSTGIYQYQKGTQATFINPETTSSNIILGGSTRVKGFQNPLIVDSNVYVYGSSGIVLYSNIISAGQSGVNASIFTGISTGGLSLYTAQSSGALVVGGNAATGAITLGQSTGTQTLNLGNGASGLTTTIKTVNIGTGGLTGSNTLINIGSTVSGAFGLLTIAGTQTSITSTITSVSTTTGALQVAGGVGIGLDTYVGGQLNVAGSTSTVLGQLGVGPQGASVNNWYNITPQLLVNNNQNAATIIGIGNNTVGASSYIQVRMIGGTANSYATESLADNNGSPFLQYDTGPGVNFRYWSFGGSEKMRLTSSTFRTSVPASVIDTSQTTNTSTGALTVTGGVAVGGNLAIGGYTYYNSVKTANIYIKGTGLNNNGSNAFYINGAPVNFTSGLRGLTFFTIDKATLTATNYGTYDTYGTANSSTQLATLLNAMTNTQIGVLISFDAIENQINTTLISALASKGLYKLAYGNHTGSRRPYAAIFDAPGVTGVPSRNVIEVYESDNATAPQAIIATSIATDGTAQGAGFAGNDFTNVLISGEPSTVIPAVYVDQNYGVTINGATTVTNTTIASSTNTGALVVQGGVGIWGNLWVGGTINATISGSITTSTNLAGGTTGQIPYQSNVGQTQFFGPGTAGQILVSNGAAAPIYQNTLTIAGNVVNVSGGVASNSTSTGALLVAGGIGVNGNININGGLNAITKSFVINHPTKPGMRLRYGSLEGPENGVYIRGRLTGSTTIQLPDYWTKLVDPESITVQITPIGKHQKLFVESIKDNIVTIDNDVYFGGSIDCYYVIFAERADTDKLEVEMPG